MCASYGLQMVPDDDDVLVDERLADDDLVAWLEQHLVARLGTTRSLEKGPFSPLITTAGMELAWWWLWTGGAPTKQMAFNARAEQLTDSRLWREPFRAHRVLIPVSYYFEMANVPGVTGRYQFSIPRRPLFAIAGIASPIGLDGYPRLSFAMVTRPPTPEAGEVHDRMPLLLPPSFYDDWLDPANAGDDALRVAALAASDEIVGELVREAV